MTAVVGGSSHGRSHRCKQAENNDQIPHGNVSSCLCFVELNIMDMNFGSKFGSIVDGFCSDGMLSEARQHRP